MKKKKIIIIVCIAILLIAAGVGGFFIFKKVKGNDKPKEEVKESTKKIKITFDVNGGKEIDPMEVDYKSIVDLPVNEKEGYLFLGWYNADQRVTKNTVYVEDITLKAEWQRTSSEKKTMKVSINLNGGTDSSGELKDFTMDCGLPIKITNNYDIQKENSIFSHWETSSGKRVQEKEVLPCEDITLKAVYITYEDPDLTKCPNGYYSDAKICISTKSPKANCEDGTKEYMGLCFYEDDTTEPSKSCPLTTGYNKRGDNVSNLKGEYINGKCAYEELNLSEAECQGDEWYKQWFNNKCYSRVTEYIRNTCPDGYLYINNYQQVMSKKDVCMKYTEEYTTCEGELDIIQEEETFNARCVKTANQE